ncbi:hypothetical protein G3M48_002284, partial [Beauveria asiatica]
MNAPWGFIRCCFKLLPRSTNVACFDTQFHKTIPKDIDLRVHDETDVEALNMIALHLGSGASACAIKNGCSWDASMGLTPVSGLPGATRSGSIDP